MERIYFDHAATTSTAEEVLEEMIPYFNRKYGNPSSIYQEGKETELALSEARGKVAALIGAERKEEIIFTGGGTEADNLAIKGAALALRDKGKHIITSQIEHHAVLHTCQYLEKHHGYEITYLPVDKEGFIDLDNLRSAVRDDTILITIMMANNEIGTIEPVKEIGKIARENDIYFHTDAVQAVGKIPVDVDKFNIDLLSLSAHKFNGPKGVGALYVRRGIELIAQNTGGAQERNQRAGTENVPGIVGLGKAVELTAENMKENDKYVRKLSARIVSGIKEKIDNVIFNGPDGTGRLPGIINMCFSYIEGESILLSLDMNGISASSGSACTSGSLEASHVLLALGIPQEDAHGSLRISLGPENTEEEVDKFLAVLPDIIQKLRDMSPLYTG